MSLPPGPDLDVLARIADAHQKATAAEQHLAATVTRARQTGQSWTAIGHQLGITRQAAQQRFTRRPSTRKATNPLPGHIDMRQRGYLARPG